MTSRYDALQRYIRIIGVGAAVVAGGVSGCGGGGGGSSDVAATPPPSAVPPPAAACGVESEKDFVLQTARDWYRWYDEMADVDPDDFATARELLAALTAPLAEDFRDPGFSYLTTVAEDEASLGTGAYVGFGFRFAIDEAGRYLVSDVFESGAAFRAGFVRGAEILAVDRGNGYEAMRDLDDQQVSFDDIFGPPQPGLERGFRLLIDGETIDVVAAKNELDIPPIADAPRLIERAGLSPVAYLHLRGFTRSAAAALDQVFTDLLDQDVTDFIVDLRYNGGGRVDVADRLLDLLGGRIAPGEVSLVVSHNDKRRDEDVQRSFEALAASALPLRVAFITSEATASASELVINSLAPEVDVVLIGADTLGKAVGQYAFDQRGCDTRLRLVAFETLNGEGLGGYYTGLADTGRFTLCAASDDYREAFGDAGEALVGAALAWLNDGICAAPPAAVAARAPSIDPRRAARPPLTQPDRRSAWVQ